MPLTLYSSQQCIPRANHNSINSLIADDPENTDDSNHESCDPLQNINLGSCSGPLREQDRFLPIANVAKIMKRAIPESGKIAKDARECVQECVSEFISFITSEASDRCHIEKRKTINGEDILYAMTTLGFDNYVEPLKIYLQKYREATKGDNLPTGTSILSDVDDKSQSGCEHSHSAIYEDQIFTLNSANDVTTSEAPIIYTYSTNEPMEFHLA
ncbi:hypothetical protein QAD02_007378 [Eretmocerus hayati]|uniref:Uncharacterized protein n=1 Tax=Eretmocerus hayati TaxID=131215 RepID=A0ACC2N4A5_9HYME|nr:hypothetical protein QAD02_007378 [Eretmocerus hayati]